MIRAVIFDLDDTLISEEEYIKSGFTHISNLLKIQTGKDSAYLFNELMSLYKADPKNVFNRLYDKLQVSYTESQVIDLVKEYRSHKPLIKYYDDVTPCLNILKANGIKLGIITDGYAVAQKLKLEAVNAYKYFEEIIITDELGKEYWKPSPLPFEIIRDKFNVKFDEMIYIGDNPEKDFYISSIYPMKTFRILRLNGVHQENDYLASIKENYRINSLDEIMSIIHYLNNNKREI